MRKWDLENTLLKSLKLLEVMSYWKDKHLEYIWPQINETRRDPPHSHPGKYLLILFLFPFLLILELKVGAKIKKKKTTTIFIVVDKPNKTKTMEQRKFKSGELIYWTKYNTGVCPGCQVLLYTPGIP